MITPVMEYQQVKLSWLAFITLHGAACDTADTCTPSQRLMATTSNLNFAATLAETGALRLHEAMSTTRHS